MLVTGAARHARLKRAFYAKVKVDMDGKSLIKSSSDTLLLRKQAPLHGNAVSLEFGEGLQKPGGVVVVAVVSVLVVQFLLLMACGGMGWGWLVGWVVGWC